MRASAEPATPKIALQPIDTTTPEAEDYLTRGNQFAAQELYQQAIEAYSSAIRSSPQYAAAYENRASMYYYTKEYQLAIFDLDRSRSPQNRQQLTIFALLFTSVSNNIKIQLPMQIKHCRSSQNLH